MPWPRSSLSPTPWHTCALSHLPAPPVEDPPIEVNNVNLLHSPRHWDMNKLAAAQQQDQPNLEAARLTKSTEGIMHLVRQPGAPEITTRQMILLLNLTESLSIEQQHPCRSQGNNQNGQIKLFLETDGQGHQGNHQDLPRLSKKQDNPTQESQTGYLPVFTN